MKLADVPEIFIRMMPSELPPTGVGEIAIPFTGAAIANAFAVLTGRRLRHLPLNSASVRDALQQGAAEV